MALILIGATVRFYQYRSLNRRIEFWNKQGSELDSLARNKAFADANMPININSADEKQLQSLPGIGPALAVRIIEWRKANGLFHKIDDLAKVNGIGSVLVEKLRNRIIVDPAVGFAK